MGVQALGTSASMATEARVFLLLTPSIHRLYQWPSAKVAHLQQQHHHPNTRVVTPEQSNPYPGPAHTRLSRPSARHERKYGNGGSGLLSHLPIARPFQASS